ncbi:hypothetical protein LSH36_1404g00024 [Paralvinella palmiformis]|uniref:Reverse transcriptase domain-containing protein n=1 Tax=Paralvinella palmiformis TaxID=53620 RepID=A0AAD9ISR0_9ANNE|nr:hypothetical protein LSH36_1404g00024 [Paralvinella palmiformis]
MTVHVSQVRDCLADFFNTYRGILDDDDQHVMELSVLCVHCLEDHYYNQANKRNTASERLTYICGLLDQSQQNLQNPDLNISKLEAIASVRFGLSEAARLMYAVYVEKKHVNIHRRLLQQFFQCARLVCMYKAPPQISKPRIMKHLEEGKNVDVLYLDFAKAFDKSEPIDVLSGVPQGFVLGPLLFLILIGDIDKSVISSFLSSFVDDMRIGSIIPEKEIVRDLGVLMSKDGTFKTHIKNVVDAAKKMCGWILRTFRTREVSPITRKSLVLSKLITAVNSGLHQRRGIFKLLKPSRDPSPEKCQASGI